MEKKLVQLIKSQESYKLTVIQDLEKKIRFLCSKLPNNEWSGTLFYSVEGSFAEKNLHIICKDFYLQDVGEAAFTEFQRDASLAAYMVSHDLLDCYTGLMHSHDTMATFFSGTDLDTLKDEGVDQNHFLSLIVNNAGTYTAAITKKITAVIKGDKNISYNTFEDVRVEGGTEPIERETMYLEYYPLDITVETVPEEPKDELEIRLEEVRKSAKSYINRPSIFSNYRGNGSSNANTFNPVKPLGTPVYFNQEKQFTPAASTKTENKFDYSQNYMFSHKEMGVPEKNSEKELSAEIPYDKVHMDTQTIDNCVKQIITGDIFSMYKQRLDIDKWAANMEDLYNKRFSITKPDEDENDVSEAFKFWVDSFIDFLESDIYDEVLYKEGQEVMDAVWAYDLIVALEKYPDNKYINVFKKSLERWLI